jgi:hypothetical protein
VGTSKTVDQPRDCGDVRVRCHRHRDRRPLVAWGRVRRNRGLECGGLVPG